MAATEDARTHDATDRWRRQAYAARPERTDELLTTISGIEVDPLATPDNAGFDYPRDLGFPGEFPFTRGVYPSMYRGRLWTMRQFAGFGTAAETNRRFRYLLEHGQTGLSTAFDMPTLMGYDSDHPRSLGEVGREGVAVDSLRDMEMLFQGIPLGDVSTSMTINSPAAIILAFYLCVAHEQCVSRDNLRGTRRTAIPKEYIARKEWIFPPGPSMRLVVDMIEFCAREMPLFHPVSISGYHIREAGSTAAQELAFTLADGFAYVEAAIERGLDVDDFAPRLSFFFNAHLDFFEEIAKYRAARRIWAREMRERYGARNERSLLMRFHTQTAGVSLTAQQPEVNIVRTALEALAAVLGGTQSLHTNSFDEALALPTEDAARLALRTPQVIAHESGAVNTTDPRGGPDHVERLTGILEAQAYEYFDRIDQLGGVVAAIKDNFFQREIAEASFRYQSEVESGKRVVVGVNRYVLEDEEPIPILRIDPALEQKQIERLAAVRAGRDSQLVESRLATLKEAASKDGVNLMPPIVDAARDYVTLGEMCDALRQVWGVWRETPVLSDGERPATARSNPDSNRPATASQVSSSRISRCAAAPMRSRSSASRASVSIASASAFTSLSGTSKPVSPGRTSSGSPPARLATSGRPAAIPSSATFGSPSTYPSKWIDGTATTSAAARKSGTAPAATAPAKIGVAANPSSVVRASSFDRSLPSPTTKRRRPGTSAAATASTRTSKPFIGMRRPSARTARSDSANPKRARICPRASDLLAMVSTSAP